MLRQKKAVITAVAILLLLFVTVFTFIALSSWYNDQLSQTEVETEQEDFDRSVEITRVDGSRIYVNNQFSDDLNITEIQVGGQRCEGVPITTIDRGLAIIDIGTCPFGLEEGAQEVALITDSGVKSEFELIRGIPDSFLAVRFTSGVCDFAEGYIRIYGMSSYTNAHVELPGSSGFSYNACAKHFNYTLGTASSGNHVTLFNLTQPTNSAVWRTSASIYNGTATWYPVSVSSSGGTFDLQVSTTSPGSRYRCFGSLEVDDVYGAHVSDCSVPGFERIWVSLD